MDEESRTEYDVKAKNVRLDLKTWETQWLEKHGKKPGREDIKSNPEIADKYRQYQRYRNILDGKISPPAKDQGRKRKSTSNSVPVGTPSKRTRHTETPSKSRVLDVQLEQTPTISRKLFSPTAVTSLGPTPQRDGKVLGLFDLLGDDAQTPSKDKVHSTTSKSKIYATPSKTTSSLDLAVTPRMGRTPMSDSKRKYLNTFVSPVKPGGDLQNTAATPSKLHFDTPQFLRRHTLSTVDENGEIDRVAPLRLPRKQFGRGLSEIVASLRKVEEDKADEDLEALRDMEAEDSGQPRPVAKPKPAPDDILVGDSQAHNLPLGGFDDVDVSESDGHEGKDRQGQPMRLFKKKGQKRTTRKVNIKPTWNKRPTAPVTTVGIDEDDEEVVPKTQLNEGDEDFGDIKAKKKKVEKKEGTVKKAARKVNELAHANFQRLKLKNSGAKGGPGQNSRFRRRR
ncbi:DNA replication/checkpoint protein [Emericellopsis atlantica]|uniref:DNA replication regulator SLD2 n=1 Tax=Emericellopsis atlantica TaxID=2614577 RepID=A0A9P7ZFD3_9HYPO|nr:DNA replication/checkpoint protein [Emericellopsis atlantica]KAG9251134.1 DNA replication/checkpoint protein [Emericellopsis atlantica]